MAKPQPTSVESQPQSAGPAAQSRPTGRAITSTVTGVSTTAIATLGSLRSVVLVEARRVHRFSQPVLAVVTTLGWQVVAAILVAWVAGALLGWRELLLGAGTSLVVMVICTGFVVGPASLHIEVELDPPRVVVGEPVAGRVSFTNRTRQRMAPLDLELPVGQGTATFHVPSLSAGSGGEELFVISTEHRGVITVGPPTAVKGDPLGLLLRKVPGGPRTELLVYPKTVALPPFGSGLLRDLEGLTTKEVSPSDLAFHSLRDYAPGDDRRYIHWRSSAKVGHLQVRQFLDTRRSALTVLVDARPQVYADPAEFELALQVAGSLVLRAARDELPALLIAGDRAASSAAPHMLLDTLARAVLDQAGPDLAALAGRATAQASDTTMAALVGGSLSTHIDAQRAAARFTPDVRILDIRVNPNNLSGISSSGRTRLLQIGALRDLPAIVATEGSV